MNSYIDVHVHVHGGHCGFSSTAAVIVSVLYEVSAWDVSMVQYFTLTCTVFIVREVRLYKHNVILESW